MNKYYYCVNTFKNGEPVQIDGFIFADSANDAIQNLVDDEVIDSNGYEFLELYKE